MRLCYRCGSNDHLAKECRQLNNPAEFPLLGSPAAGVRPAHGRGEEEAAKAQLQAVTGVPPPRRQDAEVPPALGLAPGGVPASLDHATGGDPLVPGQAAGGDPLVLDQATVDQSAEESQSATGQDAGETQIEGDLDNGESVSTEVEGEVQEQVQDMEHSGESHADRGETHSEGSVILSDGEDSTAVDEPDETQFFDAYNDENSLLEEEDDMHRHVANIALIGGSNCRDLNLEGDDEICLNTHVICEGGLRVSVAVEKLQELSPEERDRLNIVVMHIGTCDFPLEKDEDAEQVFTEYVETMNKVLDICPNIQIVMSSVLPQTGDNNEKTNRQIQKFNEELQALSIDEAKSNLNFCNNNVGFVDEQGVVDASLYRDSVHINPAGRNILARSIKECSKSVFFREKLAAGFSPVRV